MPYFIAIQRRPALFLNRNRGVDGGVETEGRVKEEKLWPGCKINEKKRKEKGKRENTSAAA